MKNYRTVLIVFLLIGITAFSAFRYIFSLKEKYDLKGQIADLEGEKQNLLQELGKEKELEQQLNEKNAELTKSLKENEDKLLELDTNFTQAQQTIEQLDSEVVALKAETAALREEKDKLDTQLIQLTQEKDNLNARLSSIEELKKAIKELRIQMRKASREAKEKIKKAQIIIGNRGFILKDGKSTYPGKVKIEVMPVPFKPNDERDIRPVNPE